jgi:hypothetical protein
VHALPPDPARLTILQQFFLCWYGAGPPITSHLCKRVPFNACSVFCAARGEPLARYFCPICHLFEDDPAKPIYHCPYCNICRIGQLKVNASACYELGMPSPSSLMGRERIGS